MDDSRDPQAALVWGALIALAATAQTIQFHELCRLCGCAPDALTRCLDAARARCRERAEPDVCTIILTDEGLPSGFRDLEHWNEELARTHAYWQDRRALDDEDFLALHRGR